MFAAVLISCSQLQCLRVRQYGITKNRGWTLDVSPGTGECAGEDDSWCDEATVGQRREITSSVHDGGKGDWKGNRGQEEGAGQGVNG